MTCKKSRARRLTLKPSDRMNWSEAQWDGYLKRKGWLNLGASSADLDRAAQLRTMYETD